MVAVGATSDGSKANVRAITAKRTGKRGIAGDMTTGTAFVHTVIDDHSSDAYVARSAGSLRVVSSSNACSPTFKLRGQHWSGFVGRRAVSVLSRTRPSSLLLDRVERIATSCLLIAWSRLPGGVAADAVTVVLELTRMRRGAVSGMFRRRGAHVVLVPAERSADLRYYYAKHTKSDRVDSVLLARLALLDQEGPYSELGLGPGDTLRRTTTMHSVLVKRLTTTIAPLETLLKILCHDWQAAFSGDLSDLTPLRFLAAG